MTLSNARRAQDLLDQYIQRNTAYCVALFLCAGFAFRCALASLDPLNADEAFHYIIANQPTLFGVWELDLRNAHPPLFYFVLRYWEMLGHSELFLRMLPTALGVPAAFMAYKWVGTLLNQAPAGWFALVFVCCAPFSVGISIELREYTLLLLLAFSALYLFERRRYYLAALACTAAILTDYSAVFLLPYFAVLLLVRHYLSRRLDWRSIWRACLPLLLPIAVFTALYFIHIRNFPRDEVREAKETWMAAGYFRAGAETVGSFVSSRIYAALANQYTYITWLPLAIAGLVLTCGLWRRLTPNFIGAALCHSAAALVMLLVVAAAAVLGYYPLSPTRHSSILLPFTLPAVCVPLTHLCRGRSSWILVFSVVLVSGFLRTDHSLDPLFHSNGRKADTARMVAILRSTAGNGKLVFVERSSALVLNYYLDPGRSAQIGLGRPPQVIATMPAEPFDDFWWGGVHVVSSPSDLWWSPELFFQDVAALGKERDLGKGIYVVNAGLSKPLAPARAFQGQQPVHWLVRNPQKPEMFWMPLGGAQPVGPTH